MNRHLQNKNGAALVVTLGIVVVMVAAALQIGKMAGNSVFATTVEKDRFQARQIAISGINLALLILSQDKATSETDSLQETWADSEKISGAVQMLGYENSELTVNITDECAKFAINALLNRFPGNEINPDQYLIFERLVRGLLLNAEEEDRGDLDEILNSLKDWLDSGDDDAITGLSGAESDYYLDLDPPYEAANGPINHVDEIWQIKGITRQAFALDAEQDLDPESEQEVNLSDYITVYGLENSEGQTSDFKYSGKINMNTADVAVLAALLPEGYETAAGELVDYRSQKNEDGDVFLNPLDKGWYKNVIELSGEELTRFESNIKYSSDLFKIRSTARFKQAGVTLTATVRRQTDADGKWVTQIIQIQRQYEMAGN